MFKLCKLTLQLNLVFNLKRNQSNIKPTQQLLLLPTTRPIQKIDKTHKQPLQTNLEPNQYDRLTFGKHRKAFDLPQSTANDLTDDILFSLD